MILCLIAPKWQIMPVMIWWKSEIIKLPRRPAACVYLFVFTLTNLCHEASRGQAVIYTNSLPQPFLDLGVITWEQNGFISFNPAGAAICTCNICSHGACTVKTANRLSNANMVEETRICAGDRPTEEIMFDFYVIFKIWNHHIKSQIIKYKRIWVHMLPGQKKKSTYSAENCRIFVIVKCKIFKCSSMDRTSVVTEVTPYVLKGVD